MLHHGILVILLLDIPELASCMVIIYTFKFSQHKPS
jgi:hypothetical protein